MLQRSYDIANAFPSESIVAGWRIYIVSPYLFFCSTWCYSSPNKLISIGHKYKFKRHKYICRKDIESSCP